MRKYRIKNTMQDFFMCKLQSFFLSTLHQPGKELMKHGCLHTRHWSHYLRNDDLPPGNNLENPTETAESTIEHSQKQTQKRRSFSKHSGKYSNQPAVLGTGADGIKKTKKRKKKRGLVNHWLTTTFQHLRSDEQTWNTCFSSSSKDEQNTFRNILHFYTKCVLSTASLGKCIHLYPAPLYRISKTGGYFRNTLLYITF